MKFVRTGLGDVTEVMLQSIVDDRGWFARAMCVQEFKGAGLNSEWVQVNQGFNHLEGTLRGIHIQKPPHAEAKFVRCISGRVFDVAVDLREGSATYGQAVSKELSAETGNGLYVPPGFGHGYQTLEPESMILYWTDQPYSPESATGVRYDDPDVHVVWPLEPSTISAQDLGWPLLRERDDL